jgi:hypothetical protein
MGYRSDVSIVFYGRGNGNDARLNTILKLWFDENYPVAVAKDEWCASIRQKDNAIVVDYHDVKWYDGYEHPKAVSDALRTFDETFRCNEPDARLAWEMVRIGEEDNDIETERSDYNDHILYVRRSIGIDLAGMD